MSNIPPPSERAQVHTTISMFLIALMVFIGGAWGFVQFVKSLWDAVFG